MYMGNTCTIKIIYDYNADNFDHSDLDFIGGMQLFSEPCEREPVNSVSDLKTASGKTWGAEWKNELRRNWDSYAGSTPRARVDPLRRPVPRPRPELHRPVRQPATPPHLQLARQRARMWRYMDAARWRS